MTVVGLVVDSVVMLIFIVVDIETMLVVGDSVEIDAGVVMDADSATRAKVVK